MNSLGFFPFSRDYPFSTFVVSEASSASSCERASRWDNDFQILLSAFLAKQFSTLSSCKDVELGQVSLEPDDKSLPKFVPTNSILTPSSELFVSSFAKLRSVLCWSIQGEGAAWRRGFEVLTRDANYSCRIFCIFLSHLFYSWSNVHSHASVPPL